MGKDNIRLDRVTMQSFILCPFLVVAKDDSKDTGVNIATISYVSVLNEDDPIIGLAIRKIRHTHGLIKQAGEFTLNLPTQDQLEILDFCGTNKYSGKVCEKAKMLGIELEKSQILTTPIIKNSPVNIECRLKTILSLSVKPRAHDFFIADVVACYHMEDFLIDNYPGIVTTNLNYRILGGTIGTAYKVFKKQ